MRREHWLMGLGVFVAGVIIALAIYNRLPSLASLTAPKATA